MFIIFLAGDHFINSHNVLSDDEWILLEENWCWSLSGRKGLNCNRSCWLRLNWSENREEKSLRHVAMVAKFLDDSKSKRHLKSGFALFQLHRSYLISFNLSTVGEIFWVESERTVSKFRKRKRKFSCCAYLLQKAGAWS